MSKLGALSLLPLAYALVVPVVLVSSRSSVPGWLIGVHLGFIGIGATLMFLCVVRIRRDSSLSEAHKAKWTLAVLFLGLIAVPVYLLTHSSEEPAA